MRKIVATPGNTGTVFDEFYLEDGKPLFVFSVHKNAETGKRVEERLYFTDGKITKWLTTDKAFVPHGEDYAGLTERLNADAATFLAALQPKSATATAKTRTATGTFLGIEQGDYAHWNMRTTDDADLSLFILHPDASVEKVLADPDAFTGRRCRVTWRESKENIPEAGGEQTISQLLSVEWLARM